MRGLNIEMSASREKKQRQVSTANGPSDKQRREMEEAQKVRSKTILYTVVGIVIAVLVIALTVGVIGLYDPSHKGRKRACGRCKYRSYCSIRAIGMTCHGGKGSFK